MIEPTLENKLEQLYTDGLGSECPVLCLKAVNVGNTIDDKRTFLMRQVPLAEKSQYHPAVTTAGYASLAQWIEAGIGDEYPESVRAYAEAALVRFTLVSTRKENKRARNDITRLRGVQDKLTEHPLDSLDHRRAADRLQYYEHKVYLGNKLIAANCLVRLQDLLDTRSVVTPKGIELIQTAQIALLMDTLPKDAFGKVGSKVHNELNYAAYLLEVPKLSTLSNLLDSKKTLLANEDGESLFVFQRLFEIVEKLSDSLTK